VIIVNSELHLYQWNQNSVLIFITLYFFSFHHKVLKAFTTFNLLATLFLFVFT